MTSKKKAVFSESSSPGGSADTFKAFLHWLDATAASWFVWENVDLTKGTDEALGAEGEVAGEQNYYLKMLLACTRGHFEYSRLSFNAERTLLASSSLSEGRSLHDVRNT